jgi:hypothetical protein
LALIVADRATADARVRLAAFSPACALTSGSGSGSGSCSGSDSGSGSGSGIMNEDHHTLCTEAELVYSSAAPSPPVSSAASASSSSAAAPTSAARAFDVDDLLVRVSDRVARLHGAAGDDGSGSDSEDENDDETDSKTRHDKEEKNGCGAESKRALAPKRRGRVQIVCADAYAPVRPLALIPVTTSGSSSSASAAASASGSASAAGIHEPYLYRHEPHEQLLFAAALVPGSRAELRRRAAVERHMLRALLCALTTLQVSSVGRSQLKQQKRKEEQEGSDRDQAASAPASSVAAAAMAAYRSSFVTASSAVPSAATAETDASSTSSSSTSASLPRVERVGGTFICRIPECTSRLNAGVFYLLHRLFSFVAFVRPASSCRAAPDRFVVATNYLGASDAMIDYVREMLRRYDDEADAETQTEADEAAEAAGVVKIGDSLAAAKSTDSPSPLRVVVDAVPIDLLLLPRVFAYLNDAHAQLGGSELAALKALLLGSKQEQQEQQQQTYQHQQVQLQPQRNVGREIDALAQKVVACIGQIAALLR